MKGRYGQEGVGAYHVLSCPNPFKTKASHLTPCQVSSERQTASSLVRRVQGLQRVIYTHCGPMLPGNIISLYTCNQPRATMGRQVCENLSLGSVGDPLYVCCTKTKTTTCYKLDLFPAILKTETESRRGEITVASRNLLVMKDLFQSIFRLY